MFITAHNAAFSLTLKYIYLIEFSVLNKYCFITLGEDDIRIICSIKDIEEYKHFSNKDPSLVLFFCCISSKVCPLGCIIDHLFGINSYERYIIP